VTAFNIRVPTFIKRTLTSLQISQFIIGASVAMVHSFISYLIPVQTEVPATEAGQSGTTQITKYQKVDCIATTGQTFGIWLNVVYLAPLTYLFVSFFVASYLRRSKAETVRGKVADRRRSNVALAEKASWDAARGIEREMYGQGNEGVIIEESDESSGAEKTQRRANGVKSKGKKY